MKIIIQAAEVSFPKKVVLNDHFPQFHESEENPMFRGTKERRHCEPTDTASSFLVNATENLMTKQEMNISEIDLFLNNATMLDIPFTGIGASWVHGTGADPKYVYDIHNSGCTSFVNMAELAKTLMLALNLDCALIGNVQTSAGKIFGHEQNIDKPQSVVPGDGSAVVLLRRVADDDTSFGGEIISTSTKVHGEFADDMFIQRSDGKEWWEASDKMGVIEFSQSRIMRILSRGNRTVPQRIREACESADKEVTDINFIITNQPNPMFLRNWREFVQLPEEKQAHSYDRHGNLFGAAMPVNLAEALHADRIKRGDLLCMAGFSHAGDYSSAMLVQW